LIIPPTHESATKKISGAVCLPSRLRDEPPIYTPRTHFPWTAAIAYEIPEREMEKGTSRIARAGYPLPVLFLFVLFHPACGEEMGDEVKGR